MPHLAGRCDCGRRIHFPKGATYGDTWTCWKCGKTWTLSTHGDPLHSERSKPPVSPVSSDSAPSSEYGCLAIVIAILVVGGIVYAVFGKAGLIVVGVLVVIGFYRMYV